MTKFEIARLDEDGVIQAVETCSETDYRTDAAARTVRLEPGHDMRKYLKAYRWNFHKNTFEALSTLPMNVAERDTSELVEGFVETMEDIIEHIVAADEHANDPSKPRKQFKLSRRMDRVLKEYRRHNKRKDKDVQS